MATTERSTTYRVRMIHRWLGLFIGVQFTLWTLGGLYFSWTDLDEVHGDPLRRPPGLISADMALTSPSVALQRLRAEEPVDSLVSLELVEVLDEPAYRVRYTSGGERRTRLVTAATGEPRALVTQEEALRIASRDFAPDAPVRRVEYLSEGDVGPHHEYREQPLPAWAVSFAHPSEATVYVPVELGTAHRVRNEKWRIFDFLWMLHTMGYASRDDFNNTVLRIFSLLGLVTIFSGFALFGLTSRRVRGWMRSRRS